MNSSLLNGPKKDLLDLMKRQGELSLDAAEKKLGLAKTTLRQHLLSLENQGLICRRYKKAGQGRPKVVFELSPEGQCLYPTLEPRLLRELLEHLKAGDHQDIIRAFFEKYWAKRRANFEAILASIHPKKTNLETRLQALRELLEAEGFMPQVKVDSKRNFTVSECNCPFREAINATDLPCRLESEFVQWALKSKVTRTGYIPSGATACVYSGRVK